LQIRGEGRAFFAANGSTKTSTMSTDAIRAMNKITLRSGPPPVLLVPPEKVARTDLKGRFIGPEVTAKVNSVSNNQRFAVAIVTPRRAILERILKVYDLCVCVH
jgi:hypothetical protein